MLNADLKYPDLTGRVIGCAMAVHSELGNGFQEVVYQRALAIEMRRDGISVSREHEMPIYYRREQVETRRVDFLWRKLCWWSWRRFRDLTIPIWHRD